MTRLWQQRAVQRDEVGFAPQRVEVHEFYAEIGKKGGETVKARHGTGFYSEIGRRGGEAVKERHGPEYYSRIGKKGGKAGARSRSENREP